MMRVFNVLLLVLLLYAPRLFAQEDKHRAADSVFAPGKIITREDCRRSGVNTLAELFRFELNMELENYPADGGARLRAGDLDSRQFKILVNGIPVGGSDMFGGRVDLSEISLDQVVAVKILYAPNGVEYGSGSLFGSANIITRKENDKTGLSVDAYIQEESAGKAYNVKGGVGAQGRHLQGLAISSRLSDRFSIGISGQRNVFEGYQGAFDGRKYITEPTANRGFEWSPYRSWNGNGYLSYKGEKLSAWYTYSYYQSALTFYGHSVQQEFNDGVPLPLFQATDYDYTNRRNRHHLHLDGRWWKNTTVTIDLSYQSAFNDRKIYLVNTGNNEQTDKERPVNLYASQTWYAKLKIDKQVGRNFQWNSGLEADGTKGYMAAAPGTYQSRELDNTVISFAGFTALQWRLHKRLNIQPGLRLAGNGLYKTWLSGALTANYEAGGNNHFQLVAEQVRRFPNFRELFTWLESEYTLLEGDKQLKPETGYVVMFSWQKQIRYSERTTVTTGLQSSFRELKDRIVIRDAPFKIPTQDAYKYANMNKYYAWLTRGELGIKNSHLNIAAAVSLIGTKGNDFATASQYSKFLFHPEASASIGYTLNQGIWINTHYRMVGRQPVYSYERLQTATDLIQVYNEAPAFHLLDVNVGKSFFHKHLEASIGLRNLANVKELQFRAVDGQQHYTGDLRTMYIGYGRGGYLRLNYNM